MIEMTSEEYRARYGNAKPRVKGKKRDATDKAYMFAELWDKFAGGKPKLKSEYQFSPSEGFASDWRLGRHKILIEVDGGTKLWNGGRHNSPRDRYKNNLATALGYRVFHFTPETLEDDPLTCINLVLRAIGRDEVQR